MAYLDDITKDWIDFHQDGEILLKCKNSLDDELVSVYSNNTIYLLGRRYPTVLFAPKMLLSQAPGEVKIEDVLCKQNNIGNGSILMLSLFEFCKRHNIRKITGYLSSVDDDHKERRDHYYKKFGFVVTEHSISKEITYEEVHK